PAWYVGYAEDTESVESIMKKFEEMEKLKSERIVVGNGNGSSSTGIIQPDISTTIPSSASTLTLPAEVINATNPVNPSQESIETTNSSNSEADPMIQTATEATTTSNDPTQSTSANMETELTERDLEELFRRTSSFSVNRALSNAPFDDIDSEWEEWEDSEFDDDGYEENDPYNDNNNDDEDYSDDEYLNTTSRSTATTSKRRKLSTIATTTNKSDNQIKPPSICRRNPVPKSTSSIKQKPVREVKPLSRAAIIERALKSGRTLFRRALP
ncbi:hypothetical protein HDU76_011714, partial [Blyttiomyces sp. JEL0837]